MKKFLTIALERGGTAVVDLAEIAAMDWARTVALRSYL